MNWIDSHCHLDLDVFHADLDAVVQRAQAKGVEKMILPAIQSLSWGQIRDLAERYTCVAPAYGLHPMFMDAHEEQDLQRLDDWLAANPAIAVGECGLDFYQGREDASRQERFLILQIELAKAHDLPLILHARKGLDEVLKHLRNLQPSGGVVHSFSGSLQQAEQLWEMGFYLGVGGTCTYERAQKIRKVVQHMPIHSLLLETDAPDQPGVLHKGERNEPSYLPEIAAVVAELRDMSLAELADITTLNAKRCFRLAI